MYVWNNHKAICNMRAILALLVIATIGVLPSSLHAQSVEPPQVISPLKVEPDPNGVNLSTGKTNIDPTALSVPAVPRLTFQRVQNMAPYIQGKYALADPDDVSYSVHTGAGSSESFKCLGDTCDSVTGTGSTLRFNGRMFNQAGSFAKYHFTLTHVAKAGTDLTVQYYASAVVYPDGETISYSYQTATLPVDPFNRTFYRPTTVSSNLGYAISITYQGNVLGDPGWNEPNVVTLYKTSDPATPLGRLTHNVSGGITDLGGRTYTCGGCGNALGANVETTSGAIRLPGEATNAKLVTPKVAADVVETVVRDGVAWNYDYTNLFFNRIWRYDKLNVIGPNGYNVSYDVAQTSYENIITNSTDSIGRSHSFEYDASSRPTKIIFPEGNEARAVYDLYGNLTQKTTVAKPGSGQPNLVENAFVNTTTCVNALCYRPVWTKDALNRQTDYVYDSNGQLIEQTDPADSAGVRRKTYISYTAAAPYRKAVVRVCGNTTTCGTSAEIRTEYDYWESTFLPSAVRQVDTVSGTTIQTLFSYDAAGRLLSEDGPLPGTDDTKYYRYDVYGRKTWEIGAKAPNALRIAKRATYRNSDDKVLSIETGTIPDATSTTLTVFDRTDTQYDSKRNPVRVALSAAGTAYGVASKSFDDRGLLICNATRMNSALFASPPADACVLGTEGSQGADRITKNVYDAAGQLLKVQKAVGTPIQQDYVTYTYTLNGKQASVKDANSNLASLTYDGYDRQTKWNFPSKTITGSVSATDYEQYGYDAVGNRTSLRKRDGSTLTYSYDALNRNTVKVVPERAGLLLRTPAMSITAMTFAVCKPMRGSTARPAKASPTPMTALAG